MKKIIIFIIGVALVLGMYVSVGHAAEPESDKIEVTVEDIMYVSDKLDDMDNDIKVLARLVYAEARGIDSKMEQAAVIWCVLNRVDVKHGGKKTIVEVVTAKHQFAYSSRTKVTDEFKMLAKDVLIRWLLEKRGIDEVGRVLPNDYLYFAGRNGHNYFRKTYKSKSYWDWGLPNPYENEK